MKIAIIENTGKDFFSSRIKLSLFLQSNGHQIYAIVPDDGFSKKINDKGIKVITVQSDVRKKSILSQLYYLFKLYRIFKKNNFDVVHCFRIQPNLIGCFAARLARVRVVIGHITGLGVAFTNKGLTMKFYKHLTKTGYKFMNNYLKILFITQNDYDHKDLGLKLFKIIRGSSVDELVFFPEKNTDDRKHTKLKLLFASRLLKSKGLLDVVNAIQNLPSNLQNKLSLIIAGSLDPMNKDSITKDNLDFITSQPFVIFKGHYNKIAELVRSSDVCILPTIYREGTPRFLLEAMASAKPIITTNNPGCDHLVIDGQNGFIVNKQTISKKIAQLFKEDLKKMGQKSFEIYHLSFSEKVVFGEIINLYRKLSK
ncbi:MAG: glycosyltransferase family 4 protein [Flavobacteriaceae bacterium]